MMHGILAFNPFGLLYFRFLSIEPRLQHPVYHVKRATKKRAGTNDYYFE
jgi:hypothetical protein